MCSFLHGTQGNLSNLLRSSLSDTPNTFAVPNERLTNPRTELQNNQVQKRCKGLTL